MIAGFSIAALAVLTLDLLVTGAGAGVLAGILGAGGGIVIVPLGQGRIRAQMSAAHSHEELGRAIDAFIVVGRDMELI